MSLDVRKDIQQQHLEKLIRCINNCLQTIDPSIDKRTCMLLCEKYYDEGEESLKKARELLGEAVVKYERIIRRSYEI